MSRAERVRPEDITAATRSWRRGYFGVGVYHPKREVNIGTLWRHAHLYGASFIFTIGRRYNTRDCTDTANTPAMIPLYHYDTYDLFAALVPLGCEVICAELSPGSTPLPEFHHPERAIYLLGAEDHGIPASVLDGKRIVQIPAPLSHSMNVAVAGTIVMYDRHAKGNAS